MIVVEFVSVVHHVQHPFGFVRLFKVHKKVITNNKIEDTTYN
jgi:hypothetical protein